MLFLLFQLGSDRYALDTDVVAEVLPLLDLKRIPLMPNGVAGVLNFRGRPVPVIDLCALTLGRPAAARLSTRIILTHYTDVTGKRHLLGLIAEKSTDTARYERQDFTEPGIANPDTPYLGPVVADGRGLIQWIAPEKLLPPSVTEKLYALIQEQAATQAEA